MLTKDVISGKSTNSKMGLYPRTEDTRIIKKTFHPQNAPLVYIETYGCQMNFSDSEIVASILENEGIYTTSNVEKASLILLNTCSIRDKAEQTIRKRIQSFDAIKNSKPYVKIGILGCMAERLKEKLLVEEQKVDLVVGPDAYRSLPSLIDELESNQKAVNVLLSREETYDNISPIRLSSNGICAFISIMRGCNNMCTFCVVPFTRGRERSRSIKSILNEIQQLLSEGYKEVTLLGQNVDSYKFTDKSHTYDFAQLLEKVAQQSPQLRVRFSTSHPKDITDEVLYTIKKYDNICKYIHLPVQSGNSRILEKMNRTYNRSWYLKRIQRIRDVLGPQCAISSDMIAGFCSETETEHQDTLSLMEQVKFDFSYMFYYSERPGTLAAKKYRDDVTLEVKKRRLQEIINRQQIHSKERNKSYIGNTYTILVEGTSKRSKEQSQGRTTTNKVVILDKGAYQKGDYLKVKIVACTPATLFGELIQ